MQLGLVLGTATSTIKDPSFQGEKLLVVQLEGRDGRADGEPVLGFDRLGARRRGRAGGGRVLVVERLGARRGDRVMVTSDGQMLQEQLGRTTPGRWSVMGLP